jgi:malate dehydrogenase (oxaloacetate-decarboxylating)(NADP+)
MKIPVFHDDRGTAIIVAAAITNALLLNGKSRRRQIVASALEPRRSPVSICWSRWARRKNIWVVDIDGVVHGAAPLMDRWKSVYAQRPTSACWRTSSAVQTFSSVCRRQMC